MSIEKEMNFLISDSYFFPDILLHPTILTAAIISFIFLLCLIIYYIFEPAIQARRRSNHIYANTSENAILEVLREQDKQNIDEIGSDKEAPRDYLLSLVIPAYNEEERLPPMLHSTVAFLQSQKNRAEIETLCTEILAQQGQKKGNAKAEKENHGSEHSLFQIIVANDGSTDGTVQAVRQFLHDQNNDQKIPIQVLSLKRNEGKGAAVRTGMIHPCNRGHFRLMVDADGATNIASLRSLLEAMKNKKGDGIGPSSSGEEMNTTEIAFGSRAHLADQSKAQRSKARTLLMNAFHFFVKALCSSRIHDTQCGFKLFTKDAALALFGNLHLDRWAFDTELVVIAEKLGLNIAEVGVEWQEIDGSKLHTGKIALIVASVGMLRDMICVRACYWLGLWVLKEKVD